MKLINQPSATSIPRKLQYGGAGGGVSLIVIWLLSEYGGVAIGDELASAITLVVSSGIAYVTKERSRV